MLKTRKIFYTSQRTAVGLTAFNSKFVNNGEKHLAVRGVNLKILGVHLVRIDGESYIILNEKFNFKIQSFSRLYSQVSKLC